VGTIHITKVWPSLMNSMKPCKEGFEKDRPVGKGIQRFIQWQLLDSIKSVLIYSVSSAPHFRTYHPSYHLFGHRGYICFNIFLFSLLLIPLFFLTFFCLGPSKIPPNFFLTRIFFYNCHQNASICSNFMHGGIP